MLSWTQQTDVRYGPNQQTLGGLANPKSNVALEDEPGERRPDVRIRPVNGPCVKLLSKNIFIRRTLTRGMSFATNGCTSSLIDAGATSRLADHDNLAEKDWTDDGNI